MVPNSSSAQAGADRSPLLFPSGSTLLDAHERLWIACICGLYLGLALWNVLHTAYPFYDDVEYLDLGNRIAAAGGPLQLWSDLWGGRFVEANRHPLYLALISMVARPELRYHRDAQLLNVALGLVALIVCWRVARRHFGPTPAVLTALLLATGRTFLECSSREWCEPMLLIFWALTMGAILDGARASGPALRTWLRAGAWAGFAFLTKGTAIFLPVSLGLALIRERRLRAFVDPRGWLFGAAMAFVASPLLVRNLRMYGSPLYNENSDTLWIDRLPDFAEIFAPGARAELPHGFMEYMHTTTVSAVLWRIGAGLIETAFTLLDAVGPVAERIASPLHVVMTILGGIMVIIAVRQLWRAPSSFARTFALVHAGFTWCFILVFSANGPNSRYFLPLGATLLLPAFAAWLGDGRGEVTLIRKSRRMRTAVAISLGATLLAFLVPPNAVTLDAAMLRTQEWLQAHVAPGDVYAVDARTHLQPRWLIPQAHQIIVSPTWHERPVATERMVRHFRAEHARYLVLDATSIAYLARPGEVNGRRYFFYDTLPLTPDGSLPLTANGPTAGASLPPGLRVAYLDTGGRWAVLETSWGVPETTWGVPAAR